MLSGLVVVAAWPGGVCETASVKAHRRVTSTTASVEIARSRSGLLAQPLKKCPRPKVLATLRDEGRVVRRDRFRSTGPAPSSARADERLASQKRLPKLPSIGTFRVVAVVTQVAKIDAATQHKDCDRHCPTEEYKDDDPEDACANMAKTSLTSVGSDADSPELFLRPSPATGHDAEMLDV